MKSLEDIKKHISKSDLSGKSKDGFEVPDGYFESLNERILAKAIREELPQKRSINWFKTSAIAASMAILLACVFLLQKNGDNGTETSIASNEMTIEESFDFILNEDLEDLTTDDFLDIENIDEILDELAEELAN